MDIGALLICVRCCVYRNVCHYQTFDGSAGNEILMHKNILPSNNYSAGNITLRTCACKFLPPVKLFSMALLQYVKPIDSPPDPRVSLSRVIPSGESAEAKNIVQTVKLGTCRG